MANDRERLIKNLKHQLAYKTLDYEKAELLSELVGLKLMLMAFIEGNRDKAIRDGNIQLKIIMDSLATDFILYGFTKPIPPSLSRMDKIRLISPKEVGKCFEKNQKATRKHIDNTQAQV